MDIIHLTFSITTKSKVYYIHTVLCIYSFFDFLSEGKTRSSKVKLLIPYW